MIKQKILMIDDNEEDFKLLEITADDQYAVLWARDGEIGLEMAIEKKPDVIILDIILPGIDGYEVCKRLKEDTRTQNIPIIMLTVKDSRREELEGLQSGADEYIPKPYNPIGLINAIEIWGSSKDTSLQSEKRSRYIEKLEKDPLVRLDLP